MGFSNQNKAELVIVGGAAVLIDYNFREGTMDVDAISVMPREIKEAAMKVADKYGLPTDWLNSDFHLTTSYSPKLREYSKYYKTFSNALEVRVIKDEYLIAMKLVACRSYKHDCSDIIGTVMECYRASNPLTVEKVKVAYRNLYSKELPQDKVIFLKQIIDDPDYEELFHRISYLEKENEKLLISAGQKYPDKVNQDNADSFIKSAGGVIITEAIMKDIQTKEANKSTLLSAVKRLGGNK